VVARQDRARRAAPAARAVRGRLRRPLPRPITRRGSFPWTYQLAAEGHRLLQLADEIPDRERFNPRRVYDYGHVLHEIQVNAWALAYRRATRQAFLSWDRETAIVPETDVRSPEGVRLDDDWPPEGLRNERLRPVRPDAVVEVERGDGLIPPTMLVEYDRTNRVDKNYDKFRRYDMYLNWWWRETDLRDAGAPLVVFVCQDAAHLEQFVRAADHELTGPPNRSSPGSAGSMRSKSASSLQSLAPAARAATAISTSVSGTL
jgi:hypothetical protein